MVIEEADFRLEYLDEHNCFDLSLIKVINAKDPEKRREEMTLMAYGVSIESGLRRIINYRLSKKKEVYSLKEYLKEYKEESDKIIHLLDFKKFLKVDDGNLCEK